MSDLKPPHSMLTLKSALAVLGASLGVAMAPVAFAADPPGGKQAAAKAAPQGAEQQKGKCDKSAPVGAEQHKCDTSDAALIGLLRPGGATQIKGEAGKSAPQGAQQLKLDGVAKPKTGQ